MLPLFGAVVGMRGGKWHSAVLHMKISEEQNNLVLWKTLEVRAVLIVFMGCESGKKQCKGNASSLFKPPSRMKFTPGRRASTELWVLLNLCL